MGACDLCVPFVQNLWNLWTLHDLAITYHARPSTLLGIVDDSWLAYQVDLACLTVGRRVERALGREQRIEDVLGKVEGEAEKPAKPDPRQFGQLAWRVRKKMHVPESGIW